MPEVGSGLAQFVMVLANAMIKQPDFILIDEPELNLHPSLQLDFLTTLTTHAKEGIVFATHSIGLARAASESIYSVRRIHDGTSELRRLEDTSSLAEFAGELSFSGYRELGFDTLLLVEGRTDVKTLHQFLRLMGKDHVIVMLPLGGDALINGVSDAELMEVKRLSDSVYALIDSEKADAEAPLLKNRQDFFDLCEKLEIRCHVLKRRATENYLNERAVKAAMGEDYRALEPYERRGDAELIWPKHRNWRIAREMTLAELMETDLGEFLDSL